MVKKTTTQAFAKKSNEGSKSKLIVFNGKSYDELFAEFEQIMAENQDPDFEDGSNPCWDIDPRVNDFRLPCKLSIRFFDLVESEEMEYHLHFDNFYMADDFRDFLWLLISDYLSWGRDVKFCPIKEGGEIVVIQNEIVVHIEICNEN